VATTSELVEESVEMMLGGRGDIMGGDEFEGGGIREGGWPGNPRFLTSQERKGKRGR